MPEKDEKEGKRDPIKVTDRRAFTLDGERRKPEAEVAETEPSSAQILRGEGFEVRPPQPPAPGTTPLAVEFSSFVLSLASTAFIQLGELEDPVTRKIEQNLEGARQMIEKLDMLRAKTQGNLDAQETEFLTGVLYELKLKFARKATQP